MQLCICSDSVSLDPDKTHEDLHESIIVFLFARIWVGVEVVLEDLPCFTVWGPHKFSDWLPCCFLSRVFFPPHFKTVLEVITICFLLMTQDLLDFTLFPVWMLRVR